MRLFHSFLLTILCCGAALKAYGEDGGRAGKLLTADLAQKILGGPLEAGSLNGNADTEMGKTWVSRVSYKTTGSPTTSLTVLIRHAASAEEAKNIFDSSKAIFKGEDVAGLGAAAYRTSVPAQLDVLKGLNWLIISVNSGRTADLAGQEKAAREILAKLPN